MRLTVEEKEAITAAARATFGATVGIQLFGSRTNDELRGGDIDLLFEVDAGQDTLTNEARFLHLLFEKMEERKVDIVFAVRGRNISVFAQLALERSVPLV